MLYISVTVVLALFLYFRWQHAMLFHPLLYREDAFDGRFRFLSVETNDRRKLEGCVYEPENFKATLLYFGGRGQDSVGLLPKLSECYPEVRIVTFNYRGYGKSEGEPNERDILADALLIYERVTKSFGAVDLLGYSLGCSVAAFVASKKNPKKLFLVAPFTSLESLVEDLYGFRLPLIRYRFDTCAYVAKTESKIYIFITKDDDIVPFQNAKRLHKCAVTGTFVELDGLNHIEILCSVEVVDAIASSL